jgi:DeoR/GlpR family transcriptional regulator of sugar metabolism
MLGQEFRRKILELIQRDGRVTVGDRERRFAASLLSIHIDLGHLDQQEPILRRAGDAFPVDGAAPGDPTPHDEILLSAIVWRTTDAGRKDLRALCESRVRVVRM